MVRLRAILLPLIMLGMVLSGCSTPSNGSNGGSIAAANPTLEVAVDSTTFDAPLVHQNLANGSLPRSWAELVQRVEALPDGGKAYRATVQLMHDQGNIWWNWTDVKGWAAQGAVDARVIIGFNTGDMSQADIVRAVWSPPGGKKPLFDRSTAEAMKVCPARQSLVNTRGFKGGKAGVGESFNDTKRQVRVALAPLTGDSANPTLCDGSGVFVDCLNIFGSPPSPKSTEVTPAPGVSSRVPTPSATPTPTLAPKRTDVPNPSGVEKPTQPAGAAPMSAPPSIPVVTTTNAAPPTTAQHQSSSGPGLAPGAARDTPSSCAPAPGSSC